MWTVNEKARFNATTGIFFKLQEAGKLGLKVARADHLRDWRLGWLAEEPFKLL
jgi:hypothetical protein